MITRLKALFSWIWERFAALPAGVAIAMVVVLFAGFMTAAIFGYRTWDFVENDNDFCLGCHLMEAPFELVGESAHRDMGCKACHHPTLVDRTMMGLSQVINNPDSLTVHAEVENEACASCHVYGDPDQWTLIARSRGHRVHFESDDPDLDGLMCVECHSTSVHQFTSTDETCRDCHEDNDIVMAGMNDVEMHCASCHAFNAPLESIPADDPLAPSPEGALVGVLSPKEGDCLSCHTMRTMVTLPEDDPHEGACGRCHNPHTQETSGEAVATCTSAGCHDAPLEEESTFHAGLDEATLAACNDCHQAHDFHSDGQDCVACHTDIFDDERTALLGPAALTVPGDAVPHAELSFVERVARTVIPMGSLHGTSHPTAQEAKPDSTFRHAEHEDLDCLSCHTMDTAHGEVTVSALGGCRQCHHTAPESDDCGSCHTEGGVDGVVVSRPMTFALSVGDPVERDLAFDHTDHADEECATCHIEDLTMAVGDLDCASCHEEHHEADASCVSCHTPSSLDEHEVESHVGCAGAGCHEDAPFEGVPGERGFCLVCHVEQEDHKVDSPEQCADCHALPEPEAPSGMGL